MPDIVVLADPLSAGVFMLTDFEVRVAPEPDAAPDLLREILAEGCEIVFVTETLAASLRQQMSEAQEATDTLLTVIPGAGASTHLGRDMLMAWKRSVVGR